MITITKDEFLEYSGINLDAEIPGLDDETRKVERTIELWTKRVYLEANRNSIRPIPTDDKLTEQQKQAIKDAICEYGMYYFRNGDLYRQSGFSEDKGQLINTKELEKIRFPKICLDILKQQGLIRRSFGRKFNSYYHDHEDY